jgi:hypothetical protein
MPRVAWLLMAVCLLIPGRLTAQARLTGSDLYGAVLDPSGDRVAGATVTITNVETNQARTLTSDARGQYRAAALPPGRYRVTAEAVGFAPATREVVLLLGQGVTIDLHVALAGTKEDIEVVGSAPVVDPSHTAVSSVVGQEQIEALPINIRNFLSFSIITPGVTNDRTPQQGASATSGLSFGGQRARSNNIMVDGLDNNDPIVGAVRATFSQEAIREFQVLTNSYSAEFGRASGGVVNIVTKSGTNEFKGNVFAYGRDESLNAKDHFEKVDVFGNAVDRAKAPFSQYQWGATLGGPIRKDRTFFFLSFERVDISANNFVNIDPAAAAVLRTNGFPIELGNVPYDVKTTELLGKIDHQWRPNHYLVLRGNFADTTNQNIEPFGGITARSRGAEQLRTDWSVSASQTDILSPRWVNEARVQFAREDQMIQSLDPNCGGQCIGNDQGGPTLELTGVASVGRQRFTPQPRLNERIQVVDTVSYFGGNHAVKAGLDFNYINTKQTALPLHFGGRYIFATLPGSVLAAIGQPARPTPVFPLEALALGLPAAYVQGYGTVGASYKDSDFSLFLQDDWRLSRRLTLKAGVRYQRQNPYDDIEYTVSNLNGAPLSYKYPSDDNNIAPRLALAFDPRGDGRTSLHAAYGLFYDNQIIAVSQIGAAINGAADGVRTLVLRFPASIAPWRAPGHRIPEDALSQPGHRPRPRHRDSVRAPGVGRLRSRSGGRLLGGRELRLREGQEPAGHHRLQPGRARPGRGPASQRRGRARRNVGLHPAVHVVRGDLVQGPDREHQQAPAPPLPVHGLVHPLQGGGQLHRLPERLHRPGQRAGTKPRGSDRASSRVRPRLRARTGDARSAAPLRAVGAVSVPVEHPALHDHDLRFRAAVHPARRGRPQRRR